MNKKALIRQAVKSGIEAKSNPNLIDRAISFLSPSAYEKRMKSRAQSAFISVMASGGGYAGASRSRRSLSDFTPDLGDSDTDILPDLTDLRARSRHLVRNNSLATGALNTTVGNVVGTGLKVQSQIDANYLGLSQEQADNWQNKAEREFNRHAKSTFIDSANSMNFADMQNVAFRSAWESGDVFGLITMMDRSRNGASYKTAIQLIEADRVSNPNRQQDNEKIAGGIECSVHGEHVAIHVSRFHPGNLRNYKDGKWDRVEIWGKKSGRRNVLHLYRHLRPGQRRGVPDLAPVIEPLKQLGDYRDAELMAAVISGMFTVFIKSEGDNGNLAPMMPTSETGGSSADDDYKLGYGAILEMDNNDDVSTANPGRPNSNYDPFVLAILRQIGTALELPFEILVGHFTASYSAARAALLQAWKFFKIRRQWLVDYFCQPIYEAIIDEAVATGRLIAPGYFGDTTIRAAYLGSYWTGDAPGQIDPLKESKANEIAEDRSWKTSAQITAETTGGDWDKNIKRRKREIEQSKDAGLVLFDVEEELEDLTNE